MLDVATLGLAPGDVRRVDVPIEMDPLRFGGQMYEVDVPEGGTVELQATSGGLYLKLRFAATVTGPCYRCLEDAAHERRRERDRVPGAGRGPRERGADLRVPRRRRQLDVDHWARDALVLALPGKILCRPDCAGMCPRCGVRLEPGVDHDCAPAETDPRWESPAGAPGVSGSPRYTPPPWPSPSERRRSPAATAGAPIMASRRRC